MLGKYPTYQPDCVCLESSEARVEEQDKPVRTRRNSIGVYTENAISAGEYIVELIGQIVDDEYLQKHPVDNASFEEYGFAFSLQDCCNISQWRDPSDFSVYDEDDDDAGSVTDESSDSGSDLGSEVDESDMGGDTGNVLSAVNQSCRPFTLENTVNIKRNDSYESSISTISTDTAVGNIGLQVNNSTANGNESYRKPEDIIINDILDSIVDEIEEVSRIITRYESAEKFEMLERKLRQARNGEGERNIQNGEPDMSNIGLGSNHAVSKSTVVRIVTSSNGVETIPVVSSSSTISSAESGHRPVRAYRTLRASEVFYHHLLRSAMPLKPKLGISVICMSSSFLLKRSKIYFE